MTIVVIGALRVKLQSTVYSNTGGTPPAQFMESIHDKLMKSITYIIGMLWIP